MEQQTTSESLAAPVTLAGGRSVATVWNELYDNAESWNQFTSAGDEHGMCQRIDERDMDLMATLRHFPFERWASLCDGAGWTQMGCVALSWCQGATLQGVLAYWRRLGEELTPGSAGERAASLINPALLPENRLTTLVKEGVSVRGAWLLIAARREAPLIDIEQDRLKTFNPAIATLLDTRSK